MQESYLKTNSLKSMRNLKLLSLKSVQLTGPYKHFSKDLRWLCWNGFHLRSIPCDLHMKNLVALDMSDSCLEVFKPLVVLQSLKILNLQNSLNLLEFHNIDKIPNLETLILWNCHNLIYVCETIEGLKSLSFLNMTGCENLFVNPQKRLKASNFDRESTYKSSIPMPCSLERLLLKGCKLEHIDHSSLNFSDQSSMEYLNLGNNPLEFLPNAHHLINLRALDLSLCSRLKNLLSLPSTLAELYINHCESLEKVTFESCRFTLQKLVYEGCTNLSEIEGFFKLVPVAKHEESDLGHMKWLKEHQDHEVCLVGVDELTKSRTRCVQVLYEFGIMSTCLPDVKIPQMSVYISEKTSTSLSFKVPEIPKNKRLTGLNMTFKYTIAGDDLVWFAKVSTTIGVNFIYNPTVFSRPSIGEAGIWLSYWPIGNMLHIKDEINVSIVVISGLEVCEWGASLVYSDDEVADGTFKHNIGWVETLGGDLSAFQLSKEAYYLCRRDFFDKMEVDEPTPRWFRNIVGGNIDHADVRGWGKTGRPEQANSSFTQLKTVRDEGPLVEESYNVAEKSGTTSEMKDAATKALNMMSEEPMVNEDIEKLESSKSEFIKLTTKETDNPVPFILNDPLISMASPGANALRYDVFLSFRGEDTRHTFMDHVYAALVRAGLNTFRDSDDVGRGLQLYPEIERAIKASEASVILLSNNYAASSWCLDELSLILGHMRVYDHVVLPVFYHVEPSDVRKQTNSFKIKVDKTSTRWTDYNVNRWKKALTEVASLKGFVVSGSETQSVKDIVDTIYRKLAIKKFRPWFLRLRPWDHIKLKPLADLNESDLGHMKWLKEYQNHGVCLIGNDELAIGGSSYMKILYEFNIISTSLLDTKDPNMTRYISESPSLCFEVLPYPKNRRLKGLDVTFKYTVSGDDLVWFAKVNTTNGIDLLYNPTVFGKPKPGEVGMWFSYWPIGDKLAVGDKVNVSIIVMSGLEVIECGASLVYTYDVADEKLESNMGLGETLGGDLSTFQLSTGAYYLCRSDFSNLMEAGRLSPDWFRILAGDAVDYTEVQGWTIRGRPKQANPRFTELN